MYRHGAYSFVEADARQWADWQIERKFRALVEEELL